MRTAMFRIGTASLALALASAGCSDPMGSDGEDTPGAGTVALGVSAIDAGSPGGSASFDLVFEDGTSELVVTRVAVVLREIELELEDDEGCDDGSGSSGSGSSGSGGSSDDCEEFSVGPVLLEVPVDGTVDQVLSIDDVRPGIYDEVEFEIHKPDDDTAADLAFIDQHPEFRRTSVRVEGTFDGTPFVYLSDLNEEREVRLSPPLDLRDGGGTTVTLTLDVAAWFRDPGGRLVDPATANDGGENENLVRDNIRDSIEGFEDRDRDGHRDP